MAKIPIITDDLIPHRPPIKMVDKIIDYDDSCKPSIVEYTVTEGSGFLNSDGCLDEECFLEIIAQAAAAQHGFNLKRDGSELEAGLLIGVRNLVIYDQAFTGDTLNILVECGTEIESVSAVAGKIMKGPEIIAEAVITVWHGGKAAQG